VLGFPEVEGISGNGRQALRKTKTAGEVIGCTEIDFSLYLIISRSISQLRGRPPDQVGCQDGTEPSIDHLLSSGNAASYFQ